MNILVFSPYYPPHTGGLETHSEEFNRHLSERGIGIVVLTPHIPSDAPARENKAGVDIIRFPAFEIVPNYPFPKFWHPGFLRAFRQASRHRPDIVVSRTRFFLTSFLALIYAKIFRKKLVHIEHGSDFVKLSSRFSTVVARIYDHTLGRLVFRCSDINVSISEAVRQFVGKFDRRDSPVIYRGIDFEAIDAIPEDISMKERHPGKIILATAARLYKWKGIEDTLETIRALPEETREKIFFLIIGDGEDFRHLKNLSRDLPVEMLGKLSREDTIATLKASDIYIHSSLPGGGLSTSLLEAMYCQCAVIATPNEGADEIVKNGINGLLIENPSSEMARAAIITLSEDEQKRISFGENAKKTAIEKFSWSRSISAYLDIFETL